MNPKYQHDCASCILVGQDADYDFYYCERVDGGSLIARYGSEGRQYQSSPIRIVLNWLYEPMKDVDGTIMSSEKKESLPLIRALRAYQDYLIRKGA